MADPKGLHGTMSNPIYFYQHIPERLDPVAFRAGPFLVDWYSLMYLVGFFVVYFLLRYRIAKGESDQIFNFKFPIFNKFSISKFQNEILINFLIYIFIGLLLGARIGYVLFYNLTYYTHNPLAVISPFDPVTHSFIGIYGLSYHGGLVGVLAAGLIFARKNNLNFYNLANFVVPAVPAGYFFGRVGNFLNGELWGRAAPSCLGMYFPGDSSGVLRYPSQLLEAFLEGAVLFAILWPFRNRPKIKNNMLPLYLLGYALARGVSEFFREPDAQIGYLFGFMTMGQLLSFFVVVLAAVVFYGQNRNEVV